MTNNDKTITSEEIESLRAARDILRKHHHECNASLVDGSMDDLLDLKEKQEAAKRPPDGLYKFTYGGVTEHREIRDGKVIPPWGGYGSPFLGWVDWTITPVRTLKDGEVAVRVDNLDDWERAILHRFAGNREEDYDTIACRMAVRVAKAAKEVGLP